MKPWTLKTKKILIIDDFPGMCSMLRTILNNYSPELITDVSNGQDAIRLLETTHFDIILCDYNLGPGKDGQQVLEETKARDLIPYSSIYIMITAHNTADMVLGAIEYKPDDYLSKPFTKEVLILRIRRLIERKESLKDISLAAQERDYDRASKLCDSLLKKSPKNYFEILRIKGELSIKMEDYDAAIDIYNSIITERNFPWAFLGLGQAYFYRKKYDEAREIFKKLIEENPNYLFPYDYMSNLLLAVGENKESQKILSIAAEKSPKAILRQQSLASISFINKDYNVSEVAYKKVIRIGKNSFHHSPDDYSGLANVYVKTGKISDAIAVLGQMKDTFINSDASLKMKSLVNQVFIFTEADRSNSAKNTIAKILNLFKENPGCLTSDDAMSLVKFCYTHDLDDEANIFCRHAIRNNHDNQATINAIEDQLASFGVQNSIIDSLMESRKEVVSINNEGVELAKHGNLSQSISLFVKAAAGMPENIVININTAQSMIMLMNKSGVTEALLAETKKYLDRISFKGNPSEKYKVLTSALRAHTKNFEKN